jgi:predicted phosphoribosyltransferase
MQRKKRKICGRIYLYSKTAMFDSIKNKFQFKFKDRTYAASILAAALEDFLGKEKQRTKNDNLTVLGIPRGGVIVADIVATKLKASNFDIVIPRKLRIPHNEEAAFGAIMGDGIVYVDDRIVKALDISAEYIEQEKNFQLQEIERRCTMYRIKETQQSLENKINDHITILIDDGAASGATVIAAARSIRKAFNSNSNKLIIGLPVVPKQTVDLLKREADHIEVVTAPSSFFNSVGQYYQSFEPVNDEKVIEIMQNRNL